MSEVIDPEGQREVNLLSHDTWDSEDPLGHPCSPCPIVTVSGHGQQPRSEKSSALRVLEPSGKRAWARPVESHQAQQRWQLKGKGVDGGLLSTRCGLSPALWLAPPTPLSKFLLRKEVHQGPVCSWGSRSTCSKGWTVADMEICHLDPLSRNDWPSSLKNGGQLTASNC